MITSPAKIAELHGLQAKKALGQNFLFDLNLTGKIAAAACITPELNIIEIGPGPGGLTQALLKHDLKKLYAIEFDERAIAGLQELKAHYGDKLEVLHRDALKTDLREIAPAPAAVVANLPYNIATKLLTDWLEYAAHFRSLTLMFQKEVAGRLTAVPRTKDYGRLSVITQWLCEVETLFDIPPSAFVPPPKVTSTVVHLVPRETPLFPADKRRLETVLRNAFGQRRKMLKSSLKAILPDAGNSLKNLGINPESRAEELTVQEFCKIANTI